MEIYQESVKKLAWMYTETISDEIIIAVASWFLWKKKNHHG